MNATEPSSLENSSAPDAAAHESSEVRVAPVDGSILAKSEATGEVGVVAIGRNEGERLRRCLQSVVGHGRPVVYVDSGSTDDSVAFARSIGVDVVELDMSMPFTMSRGRNAGWQRLLDRDPNLLFIQFVDGDCEVIPSWIDTAAKQMKERDDLAAISGRRRERYPDKTVYNRLADMEWDTPVGEADAVMGDMMVRVEALKAVDGFDDGVIAAEDDDLCVRMRGKGWKILRVEDEMSIHDAAMTRFSQWWKRMVRCGHGFAQVHGLHGKPPMRHFHRELRRTVVWGGVLPLLAILLAWPTFGLSLLVALGLYAVSMFRTYRYRRGLGDPQRAARSYAWFVTLSKFPSMLGALTWWKRRALGQAATIIEYKGPDDAGSGSADASAIETNSGSH